MKKLCSLVMALLVLLAVLPGLNETRAAPLRVGALKGPTAMGLVKLMEDARDSTAYAFTLAASPDALVPALARGELDLACLPVNLAAILYANTQGALRVVNINTLGVLYIVERGESVHQTADLAGRTVYASGKASTPEYVLSHLLTQAGLEDVTVEWKAEHAEALAALLNDPAGLAMLPQPFVTVAQTRNPDIRIALDLNAEREALGAGTLITGVTVARAELIDAQPERLAAFLADHEASAAFVSQNIPEAARLIGGFDIINEQVAQKALPYCGITFISGEDMVQRLQAFYQMLFEQNPASTGGALPDDAFYYRP